MFAEPKDCRGQMEVTPQGNRFRAAAVSRPTVHLVDDDGEVVQTYESRAAAARALGDDPQHVTHVCNGVWDATRLGYKFRESALPSPDAPDAAAAAPRRDARRAVGR